MNIQEGHKTYCLELLLVSSVRQKKILEQRRERGDEDEEIAELGLFPAAKRKGKRRFRNCRGISTRVGSAFFQWQRERGNEDEEVAEEASLFAPALGWCLRFRGFALDFKKRGENKKTLILLKSHRSQIPSAGTCGCLYDLRRLLCTPAVIRPQFLRPLPPQMKMRMEAKFPLHV
ncbi:hypothetical protein NE237_007249 [Protea cynaroides]|uniref:Uncharacterized protein n=1 Tax=Protea cynaroides TaxID=273540 RepID=A0A9Q0KP33_9MAGN|nr:hypothetical protein NE237_007249 [Protea cynaroides]